MNKSILSLVIETVRSSDGPMKKSELRTALCDKLSVEQIDAAYLKGLKSGQLQRVDGSRGMYPAVVAAK